LKFPRFLAGGRCAVPLKLPRETAEKRPGDDTQGSPLELGIFLGSFGESEAIQLRVNLDWLHQLDVSAERVLP
jgi:hypothetical protein